MTDHFYHLRGQLRQRRNSCVIKDGTAEAKDRTAEAKDRTAEAKDGGSCVQDTAAAFRTDNYLMFVFLSASRYSWRSVIYYYYYYYCIIIILN